MNLKMGAEARRSRLVLLPAFHVACICISRWVVQGWPSFY